jgi:oligopeptide/dipeptide ABC transporter ATP-binding protein
VPNSLLEVRSLKKYYTLGHKRSVRAVDGVSFSVNRGEFLGIVGESGCGKSSLGRMALRLIEPTAGQVFFAGRDITALPPARLGSLRRSMQMIFQNPFGSFNPKMRVGEALTEVGRYHGMSRRAAADRIGELLSYIGLSAEVLSRIPRELSGGQLQRLAIARSLITGPEFIVADEPVSALDVSVQAQLLNLLCDLRRRLEMTMLFISHDIMVVEYLCDRAAVMYLGKIVEIAPAEELFLRPLHPYTKALIGAVPKLTPPAEGQEDLLEGDPAAAIAPGGGCRFAPRCRFCRDICRNTEPELLPRGEGHYAACHVTEF